MYKWFAYCLLSTVIFNVVGCQSTTGRRPPLSPWELASPSRLVLVFVEGLNEQTLASHSFLSRLAAKGLVFPHWNPDHLHTSPLIIAGTLSTGVYPKRFVSADWNEAVPSSNLNTAWRHIQKRLPASLPQTVAQLGGGVTYAIANSPAFIRPFTNATFDIEPVIRPSIEPTTWLAEETIRRILQSENEQDTLGHSTIRKRDVARYQTAADWRTLIVSLDGIPLKESDVILSMIHAHLEKEGYLREVLLVVAGLNGGTRPVTSYTEETLPTEVFKKAGIVKRMSYDGLLRLWLKQRNPESTGKLLHLMKDIPAIMETQILKIAGNDARYVRAFRTTASVMNSRLTALLDNAATKDSADLVAVLSDPAALGITSKVPPLTDPSPGLLLMVSPNLRLTKNEPVPPIYHSDLFPLITRALQIKDSPHTDGSNSALNGWLRE